MNMDINQYAKAIASAIGAEAREMEKANGVILHGIFMKQETGITPTIYIDEYFLRNVPVEEAAKDVKEAIEFNSNVNVDVSFISDWERVKPMLRARLYNKKTSADIKRNATRYGFDDLVIIPYITDVIKNGSVKVTRQIANAWGVTDREIIDTAMKNVKPEATINNMCDVLKEILTKQGMPEDIIEEYLENSDKVNMMVISTKNRMFGAISIITMRKELEKKFPNGYAVLPSSVHEVIVIPIDEAIEGRESDLDSKINEVNATSVLREERLGSKAYIIRKAAKV